MKKISLVFALFILFFAVSCDSDLKFNNPNDINSDAYQGDSDQITPDDDSEPADDSKPSSDTEPDDQENPDTTPDNGDSQPDNGDTTPDNSDSQPDGEDTAPDNGDSEPDEDADTDSTDTADEDYTEDVTDTGTEIGETRVQDCSELPENARWNTVSAIVQTWDGEKWVPSSKTEFNMEGSEDECRFKCNVNYGWNGSKCSADTKNVYCDAKPENTVWNDGGLGGTFTQTWNGSSWIPASHAAIYSKTPAECGFICATGYLWDGLQCETAPTQVVECTGLPSGAQWNTASSITQTWDSEKWIPESTTGVYNETASSTECRFKCKDHYTWNNSQCVADTKNSPCIKLPTNGQWNTAVSITQTWNGVSWQPSTDGVYDTNPSTTKCRFKCKPNYKWISSTSKCEPETNIANCIGKPANTVWNGTGKFEQTWNGEVWYPETYEPTYNKTAGTCTYICDTGYNWNDGSCTAQSTLNTLTLGNICTGLQECSTYEEEDLSDTDEDWDPPTDEDWGFTDNDWGSTDNEWSSTDNEWSSTDNEWSSTDNEWGSTDNEWGSTDNDWGSTDYDWVPTTKAEPAYDEDPTLDDDPVPATDSAGCPISPDAGFYGQDAQYAKIGFCAPLNFTSSSNVVVDNNTGLTWEKTLSAGTYTWEIRETHCNELNSSNFGGKSNWRVPNPLELLTIVDNSKYYPATNSNFSGMPTDTYLWAANENKGNTSYAYYFAPAYGIYYNNGTKTNSYKVLCVSGEEMKNGVFTSQTISGQVVVNDSTTGLMWQKEYVTGETWKLALKHCEDLTYAGYNDWRLPNKNELASLLSHDKSSAPYSDFPDMPSNSFWSSSTCVHNIGYAWSVNFYYETMSEGWKNDNLNVRCVRSEKINDPCENHTCGSVAHSSGVCVPENAFEYSCACDDGYFWNGEKCVNPCNANPCSDLSNSPKICIPLSVNGYSCTCNQGYWWNESVCKEISLSNICTSQTSCYNASSSMTCQSSSSTAFFGQDAQYRSKCTAQNFTASSNVVVDNNTGLTWEKLPSSSTYTWADRNTHCSELNTSNYGGKSNWRVPNPFELITIIDNSRSNPATNSNFTGMPASLLWTNSEYKGNTSDAYFFSLPYGWYWFDAKTNTYKVLCVSGDELVPAISSDFTTLSDGKIVADNRTGLMWQKEYATKTWQQALKYCEDSTYAGYSDWRLPNKNELASLLDPSKSSAPYSNFPNMLSNWFWSSSTNVGDTSLAWTVFFDYGSVDSISKTSSIYVRCVR